MSGWMLFAHAAFVVALAVALALLEWSIKGVPPWPVAAIMFALGAAVGLAGAPARLSLIEAGEPYRRLRMEFTRGRFFTLACPTFSPRYWRAARELRRTLADRGIAPYSTPKAILAAVVLGLAYGAGWVACILAGMPGALAGLTFLGCMLTWMDLPMALYRRRVRSSAGAPDKDHLRT